MAQVVKAGNVVTDISSNSKGFVRGFLDAVKALDQYGTTADRSSSKSKALDDRVRDLERRKKSLQDRLKLLDDAQKSSGVSADSLRNRIANLTDRIDTQKLKIGEYNSKLGQMPNILGIVGEKFKWVGNIAQIAVGNILADAFRTATRAIRDLGRESFNSAMQTEQQAVAFRVLTGSVEAGRDMMKQINKFAVRTPYDIAQLRDIAKQFLGLGIAQGDVIKTTEMLGDISAGTGSDLKLLAKAYTDVKAHGKLYGQEMRQLANQSIPIRQLLAESFDIPVDELMGRLNSGSMDEIIVNFEKFHEIMELAHQNQYVGLLGEQANTAGGRLQNLQETLKLTTQNILGIDTVTGEVRVGSLFELFSNSLQGGLDFINQNSDQINDFFFRLEQKVRKLVDVSLLIGKNLYSKFITFGNWVRDNQAKVVLGISAIGGALGGVLAFYIKTSLIPAIKMLLPKMTILIAKFVLLNIALAPYILIGALIALIIAGLILAFQNWGAITEWFTEKWNQLTTYLMSIEWINALVTELVRQWTWAYHFIIGLWGGIVGFFAWVWDWATTIFNNAMTEINRVLGEGWAYALGYFVGLWFLSWQLMIQYISEAIVKITPIVLGFLAKIAEWLWELPGNISRAVARMIASVLPTVINFFFTLAKWLWNLPGEVSRVIAKMVSAIIVWWAGVLMRFGRMVIDLYKTFKDVDWWQIGIDIIVGLWNGISSWAGNLINNGKELANSFTQGFKEALGIQSPSRVMFDVGVNIVEGLDLGIQEESFNLERTVGVLSNVVTGSFNDRSQKRGTGGLTINQYGASISTTWVPSYAR